MSNLSIDKKILLLIGAIFVIFIVGLTAVIITTSSTNLTQVKQDELARTSRILVRRLTEMEQNAVLTVRNFEENEQIAEELALLTNLGPYYADPGSFFGSGSEYLASGTPIEDADQIYAFQAQLNLIQSLQPVQQINNLTSISFYAFPPFELAPEREPVLTLRLQPDRFMVARFTQKGAVDSRIFYQVAQEAFAPPDPDYFDISSAYSAAPEQFYKENRFVPVSTEVDAEFFPQGGWHPSDEPRSEIVFDGVIPLLQTWYPVEAAVPHPETWNNTLEPVGLALVEQRLDTAFLTTLKDELGLEVGLGDADTLLISSVGGSIEGGASLNLNGDGGERLPLGEQEFYYALESVGVPVDGGDTLTAVVFSPVSEVTGLISELQRQIWVITVLAMAASGFILYFIIRSVITQPLDKIMQGVQLIRGGDLEQEISVGSQDELGELAIAFNEMTAQLRQILLGLEQRVDARTRALEAGAEVSRSISTILDQQQLVAEVVEEVRAAFDYYHVHIYLVDETENKLRMVGGTGKAGATMLRQGHALPLGEGLVGQAADIGETVLVPDVSQNPAWIGNPLLPDTKAEIAVPIILGQEVLGVLDVQEDAVEGLSSEDARLLNLIANQIAVALRNARLYEQVQQQARQTEVINQVGQKIQAAHDLERVLQVTAQELGRALPLSRAWVQIGQCPDEQNGQ